jgi:hypothetical protein
MLTPGETLIDIALAIVTLFIFGLMVLMMIDVAVGL